MSSISKAFSATGLSGEVMVKKGQSFTYDVTGSFTATLVLQQSPNGLTWNTVKSTTTTVSSTTVVADEDSLYRWNCTAYTSGTPTCTIAEVSDVVAQYDALKIRETSIEADTINEIASGGGVTVDGVLLKDARLTASGGVDISGGTLTMDGGTGTASSDAVTINKPVGVITTESKTTAAGGTYTITLTNSVITTGCMLMAIVEKNSGGGGTPVVANVLRSAGSATITVQNIHASAAFDGAHKIMFVIVLP